jgi:hypothetical protein
MTPVVRWLLMKNVASVDYEQLLSKLINEIINLSMEHHTAFCHNDITKIWNKICYPQCIAYTDLN